MKRPFIHFYTGDWQSNSNLRRCTHEEKGIWIDILCILNDQEEHGIVRWTLKELAQAVGTTPVKIKGLVDKGILKGAELNKRCAPYVFTPTGSGRKKGNPVTLIEEQEGPLWYSSRMVVDEYKRNARGDNNSAPKDTPDNTPKPPPNNAPKGGIGATLGEAPKPPPNNAPDKHLTEHLSRADVSMSLSMSGKPKTPPSHRGKKLTTERGEDVGIPQKISAIDSGTGEIQWAS